MKSSIQYHMDMMKIYTFIKKPVTIKLRSESLQGVVERQNEVGVFVNQNDVMMFIPWTAIQYIIIEDES